MGSNKSIRYLPRNNSQSLFLEYTVELWTSANEQHKAAARTLYNDWQTAKARVLTELTAKLAHYEQLPWKLLALAHHDRHKATQAAQTCLNLWEAGGVQCAHRQCHRFLSPEFRGTASDPALRRLVEQMASGADIAGPEFQPLRWWLARFQTIKLVERSVEGVHAIITRSLKRAPAAGVGYLSVELRFHSFWASLSRNPAVPCQG